MKNDKPAVHQIRRLVIEVTMSVRTNPFNTETDGVLITYHKPIALPNTTHENFPAPEPPWTLPPKLTTIICTA